MHANFSPPPERAFYVCTPVLLHFSLSLSGLLRGAVTHSESLPSPNVGHHSCVGGVSGGVGDGRADASSSIQHCAARVCTTLADLSALINHSKRAREHILVSV